MMLFFSFIQWWLNTAAKCDRNVIINDCGNHSCEQCWAGGRLNYWSGSRGSWWVIKCEETSVVAALRLLIARCTAEKRDIFHTHSSVINSDVEFVYEIYLNYEFDEFRDHQQSDLIEKALNENCFESFIIKVVMFDDNV